MVKPPLPSPLNQVDRTRDQREIRDWHTLVAKLASEAETLHSWTERPAEDVVDEKIQGTLSDLASGLAGDARRLASAMPGPDSPDGGEAEAEDTASRPAARAPGTGTRVDKTV